MISQFENMLKKKSLKNESVLKPMSLKELNSRIDKSEQDFKTGKFKTTSQLLEKFK